MDKMRPAITLFITLAVIVALLALVGITFGYLSEARAKAQDKSALIEANLIYADVSSAVSRYVGKKPTIGTLKNIYNIPISIRESKGPFSLLAACTAARAAVPISWLRTNGGSKMQSRYNIASSIIEDTGVQNRLKDTEKLKDMISDVLNSKNVYNFGKEARLKRRKNYLSWVEFKKILDDYYLKESDANVYKVNWKSYFSFGEGYREIDGSFLSAKLISIIFSIDEKIVEEDFKSGHLKKFLYENGADMELYNSDIFAKKAVVAMECSANYAFGKGSYSLKFRYINGKVEGFEFVQ